MPIDPDIRRAKTLPGSFYSDAALFERSREAIFARSWQFIGDAPRTAGSYAPMTLLPGMLDEPIVLTRDEKDGVHALSNVCTHRGNIVCEGEGHAQALRCRYHGRRFGLDGTFQSMPGFEGVENFPTAADDLARVPTASWGPFVFAGVRPSMPLDALMAGVPARGGAFDPAGSRDYVVKAHWALYVDNYLEGFHVPFVHQALAAELDVKAYGVKANEHSVVQYGVGPDGREVVGEYWWVWPNTMLNFYPWGVSVNLVLPQAVDRTRVLYRRYVSDPSKLGRGAGGDLDRVEREDEAVVESVQRGLRSRFYDRGRFSPKHEPGVHLFHRRLETALAG